MIAAALFLSFLLNIANHGNIIIGILNSLLLLFSICFYYKFNNQKLSVIDFKDHSFPLVILIGAIPLFTRANDVLIIILAIGISLLALLYLRTKYKNLTILIIVIYTLFACFYANGLIKPPFSLQPYLLIINDDWTNLYITQMQTESMYLPNSLRLLLFNISAHSYVLLSKIAGLFSLENLYNSLLVANIYPLIKGLIWEINSWIKSKALIIYYILLISFLMVFSRSGEINNAFLLMSSLLIYFILRGLNSVNKAIYLALFIISIVVALSP